MPDSYEEPFLNYLWLLNEDISGYTTDELRERLSGSYQNPYVTQYDIPLIDDLSAYDTSGKATVIAAFQAELHVAVDSLLDQDLERAAEILSKFTRAPKVVPDYWRNSPDEGKPVLREHVPLNAWDLRLWYWLRVMASFPTWTRRIGRCPILDCEQRYFAKRRSDQTFCSARHQNLWSQRKRRGLDPGTGEQSGFVMP